MVSRRSLVAATAALGLSGGAGILPTVRTTALEQARLSGVRATPGRPISGVPPEVTEHANDWPMAQGNLAATRAATRSPIDSGTVGRLGVAWKLPLDAVSAYGAITSNPIVVGDTVYIVDQMGNVQAIEREIGKVGWRRDYNVPTVGPNGVAIGHGLLISVLGDTAEVVALAAETGEEVWRHRLADRSGLGVTMAPLIHGGRVVVGTEPGGNTNFTYEGGAAGTVFSLDLHSGATLWQWNTTTDDLWGNPRVNSGGGVWYPPSVDEDGVLYLGVGNAAPFPGTEEFPNGSSRPGPNDYANCLVALDPDDGHVLWHINVKPHDLFDHDNQQTPVLATVSIEGKDTEVVFSSGKHGYVVAADQRTGTELWRTAVGEHENDLLQELPADYVRVAPGLFGGVESPMAYRDGVLYAAVLNLPTEYNHVGYNYGSISLDAARGELVALDAATGDLIWSTNVPSGLFGAGPTIANDVVFIGALDGLVRGYSTADGSMLWSHQLDAGLNAPFAVAGEFLFVPAGAFLIPSADSAGLALPAQPTAALVALRLRS